MALPLVDIARTAHALIPLAATIRVSRMTLMLAPSRGLAPLRPLLLPPRPPFLSPQCLSRLMSSLPAFGESCLGSSGRPGGLLSGRCSTSTSLPGRKSALVLSLSFSIYLLLFYPLVWVGGVGPCES